MNLLLINFNLMIRQMVEAMIISCAFIIGHLGAENMSFILLSILWFVIGAWIGKKFSDRKWIANATEPNPIAYNGFLYKVRREQKQKEF